MGLASGRSPATQPLESRRGIGIVETIAMKEGMGIVLAPGLVVILESFPSADPQAFVGREVRLLTPEGGDSSRRIAAIRDHGTTISVFFPGLTRAEVPVGSRIVVDD